MKDFLWGFVAVVLIGAVIASQIGKFQAEGRASAFQVASGKLASQNEILKAENATLTVDRDAAARVRDSIRAVSDSVTRVLRNRRTALPPSAAVPDTALRAAYDSALALTDSLFDELARRDEERRKAKEAEARAAEIEANLRAIIANESQRVAFAQRDADHAHARASQERERRKVAEKLIAVAFTAGAVIGAIIR